MHGIGARKAEDLGETVLDVIRQYSAEHGLTLDAPDPDVLG